MTLSGQDLTPETCDAIDWLVEVALDLGQSETDRREALCQVLATLLGGPEVLHG